MHAYGVVALPHTSLRLDPALWAWFALGCAVMVAIGTYLILSRRGLSVGMSLIVLGTILLALRAGLILSYITASLGRSFPLCDPLFAAADRSLGFDWMTMLRWFDEQPWMADLGWYAYWSFLPQQFVVPLMLVAARQYERAQTITLIFLVSLLLTHVVATFAPAISSYPHYQLDPSHHPNVRLAHEHVHVDHYLALRRELAIDLDRPPLFGLTTFPSLHAAMAVAFGWAFWSLPHLRWAGVSLNTAMLAFTPLHGSHYLIDVLAGMVLAVLVIVAGRWIMQRVGTASRSDMKLRYAAAESSTRVPLGRVDLSSLDRSLMR